MKGSSYKPLPTEINRACININNKDDVECFKWSIIAHDVYLNNNNKPPINPDRLNHYNKPEYTSKYDFTGITFPAQITDIDDFEKLNNISINVFGYKKKEQHPYPIRISEDPYNAINLLLLDGHYSYIKDIGTLTFHFNSCKNKKYPCLTCCIPFSSLQALENHKPNCGKDKEPMAIKMPKENQYVEFTGNKKFKNKMEVPYVIYSKIETAIKQVSFDKGSHTKQFGEHVPTGFSIYVVSIDPNYKFDQIVYKGNNVMKKYFEKIIELKYEILKLLKVDKGYTMTDEDIIRHQNATHCHICGEKLNGDCVKDHNHYTGKYRGPAHNECNVNFKAKKKIPVIMHGLKNCDGHFIIKEANKYKFDKISCIPLNKEKYLTFTLDQLQFIDSQQFMNESLEILTKNLKLDKDYNKTTELFHHTKKYYQGNELDLTTENHTELKSDVLLLADVFENFRAMSMKNYELDPCHYFTAFTNINSLLFYIINF